MVHHREGLVEEQDGSRRCYAWRIRRGLADATHMHIGEHISPTYLFYFWGLHGCARFLFFC
jgi:hypothetical protein